MALLWSAPGKQKNKPTTQRIHPLTGKASGQGRADRQGRGDQLTRSPHTPASVQRHQHSSSVPRGRAERMVWDARRALSGPAGPIEQGGQLHISEAPWLWDGVFIRGVTNLITAPPKLGKSRLLTSLFGALANGRDEFLGRKLHRGEQPKFLIVGSDQPERDWAKCLKLAGLLTPDNRMWDCIMRCFTRVPLHLDDEGIDTIAGYCRKHPDLIVGIDSYHACTAQLGLQEKDASFADPLLDLQEATAGYHPTIALIHHSKKGGGTRASEARRGSNALPGAVSQTITLNWCQDNTGNPLAPRDNRVKLSTEGREDMPLDMVIEQTDAGWICHGSGEEVAQAQAIQDVIDKLKTVSTKRCGIWRITGTPPCEALMQSIWPMP